MTGPLRPARRRRAEGRPPRQRGHGLPAELEDLRPEVAGDRGRRATTRYGHPAPSTLAALRGRPRVVRTDRDGTVRLHAPAARMTVERLGPDVTRSGPSLGSSRRRPLQARLPDPWRRPRPDRRAAVAAAGAGRVPRAGPAASRSSRATPARRRPSRRALSAMTFAMGRRFVIADGVERWKDARSAPVAAALDGLDAESSPSPSSGARRAARRCPPRWPRRSRPPAAWIAAETAVKPRELPRWVAGAGQGARPRARPGAARALIAQVGDRQQRLLRELEKLALELGARRRAVGVEEIDELCAGSAERKAWTLADAVVAGDREGAMRALHRAARRRASGCPASCTRSCGACATRSTIAVALEAGRAAGADQGRGCGCRRFAADRLIADVAPPRRRRASAARWSCWPTSSRERAAARAPRCRRTPRRCAWSRRSRGHERSSATRGAPTTS